MQTVLMVCLLIGSLLNAASGFGPQALPVGTQTELLWIANDLFLVLGLIGLLLGLHTRLNAVGKFALLLTITSLAFIAGPSATLAGTQAYAVGAPLAGLGFLLFSLSQMRSDLINRWIPMAMLAGITASLLAPALPIRYIGVLGGLLLNAGLAAIALVLLRSNREGRQKAPGMG